MAGSWFWYALAIDLIWQFAVPSDPCGDLFNVGWILCQFMDGWQPQRNRCHHANPLEHEPPGRQRGRDSCCRPRWPLACCEESGAATGDCGTPRCSRREAWILFLIAFVLLWFEVPAYSQAKASYTLGLTPAYAVLCVAGLDLLPPNRVIRSAVIAFVHCWCVLVYCTYFVI